MQLVVLVEDPEIILDLLELKALETVDKVEDLLHHRQQLEDLVVPES
jgi:hypothetical protein